MSSALERILGLAEGAISTFERIVLVPTTNDARPRQPREAKRRARNARSFRVLEVIEQTGEVSWLVSNGYDHAACNSAEFAERVKVALE